MSLRRLFAPVVVVGAGPAGATAARALALAGVPVRLIDRSAFPRNKPCGGGISMRLLGRFPFLEPELGRIATHALSRLQLLGPDGACAIIEAPKPAALMIRRLEFDALLVSLAVQAGAELVTGAEIVQASESGESVHLIARDGRKFEASVVIAADGVHSVVARRLGIRRGWARHAVALDMMEETPRSQLRDLDPSTLWVGYGYGPAEQQKDEDKSQKAQGNSEKKRLDHRAPEGYAYIFPKRDHVNIGIGYVLSYYQQSVETPPYELQGAFVEELRTRGLVAGSSVRSNFTPFHIPVGGPLRRPGRRRVLLAGDAGGFVNAFTAEGIYYAMVTGELAAASVVEAVDRPAAELASAYGRACAREIGAELEDAVLIQKYLFADRRRLARIIRNAPRFAATTRAILEYATGDRSYQSIRFHLLTRCPELALRLMWERVKGDGWPFRSAD